VTTVAERRQAAADNRAARDALIKQVLELDAKGLKGGEIAEYIGRSPMAVSRILTDNGHRKKTRGVRKPGRPTTHERTCALCGKREMIRSDHKHTRYCAKCAFEITSIKHGREPPNKGEDTRTPRACETCGTVFKAYKRINNPTGYRYGTYCSRACYGLAQRTEGSRYSDFDTFGRKRWHR
jgi:hypothetical protein